jgi:hypothetical protein
MARTYTGGRSLGRFKRNFNGGRGKHVGKTRTLSSQVNGMARTQSRLVLMGFRISRHAKRALILPVPGFGAGLFEDFPGGGRRIGEVGARDGGCFVEGGGHGEGGRLTSGLEPGNFVPHLGGKAEEFVMKDDFLAIFGLGQDLNLAAGEGGTAILGNHAERHRRWGGRGVVP